MNFVKVRCPQFLIENKALALMLAQPSMIKRPVLDLDGNRRFTPRKCGRRANPEHDSTALKSYAPSPLCVSLIEFDHVARCDAAGRAMEQVAIDDGAQFWRRQDIVSPHQVLDFEAAVFADGLQRGNDMRDFTAFRERQQQPLIVDSSAVGVIDVEDGVDRKRPLDTFVVDRHHDGRQSGTEIFVGKAALAGMAMGARDSRAVALDDQPWRLRRSIDRAEHKVQKLVLESGRLIFLDARNRLRAGVKPQPRVQEITLLDRLDDRRFGALKFQG
jgi:hypothetical protein